MMQQVIQKISLRKFNEGGYSKQWNRFFFVDKTALYWKMSFKTLIAVEELSVPGFKVLKDRLTLLLVANAVSDFKLKPVLIYHSKNPRTLNSDA